MTANYNFEGKNRNPKKNANYSFHLEPHFTTLFRKSARVTGEVMKCMMMNLGSHEVNTLQVNLNKETWKIRIFGETVHDSDIFHQRAER